MIILDKFAILSRSALAIDFQEVYGMRAISICLLMLLFCYPVSVSAEFYKYFDENGNVHFTDDFNRVPVDQRPNVKGYTESVSPEETDEDAGAPKNDKQAGNDKAEDKASEFANQLNNLDERKEALDKEYQSLIEENSRLEQMRKTAKTADDVKKYNQSVNDLNKKLQAHDKKRQVYASDVEAYNAKIIDLNAKKLKKSPQTEED